MKKYFLVGLAIVLSFNCIVAQDTWKPAVLKGFGNTSNSNMNDLHVFNSQLYAASGNNNGYVYRSNNGHPGSWQQVFADTNSNAVLSINSTAQGGGYIYISSYSYTSNNNKLYRSSDGINWTPYLNSSSYGLSKISLFSHSGSSDSVYVVTDINGGSAICRSAYNSNDADNLSSSWDTVLNVSNVEDITTVNTLCKYNNTLYAGSSNNNHYLFYSYDGSNWITDTLFQPNRNNLEISVLGTYGGYIYIGTKNLLTGPELWRTNDNINYTQIATFPGYNSITSINDISSQLWVTLENTGFATGGRIIKSNDGINFSDSNADGFNVLNNNGENGKTIYFNNNVYYSCNNYALGHSPINVDQGGQLWRYCLSATSPSFTLGSNVATCTGNSVTLDAGAVFNSYYWSNGSVSQTISPAQTEDYFATVTDVNSCASTDTVNLYFYPLPEVPTFSQSDTNYVCKGSSLTIDINEPEFSKYAVKLDGSGAYVKGADYTQLMNTDESFTFEIWFKADTSGVLVNETDSTTFNWNNTLLEIDTLGNVKGRVMGLTEINLGTVNFFQWNHAALRYDKTNLKLEGFINGILSTSFQSGDRNAPWESGYSQTFNLGQASNNFISSGYAFQGQIGEVNIWNYPRIDADISIDMTSSPAALSSGLVASYRMNSGSGNIAFDSTLNHLNSDLEGNAYFVSPAINTWAPFTDINTSTGNSVITTPNASVTYTVTSTSIFGCVSNSSINIIVPKIQTTVPTSLICYGSSQTLSATGGNTYYWSPSAGLSSTTGQSVSASPLNNTNYFVTDTIQGCALIDSSIISVNPQLTISAGTYQTVCYADTVTLNANASGGIMGYTYFWNNGTTNYNVDSTLINPISSSTYTLTITDANNCVVSDTMSINVLPRTDIYGHASFTGTPDTSGVALLYDYLPTNSTFTVVATSSLNNNGDFHFTNITHGDFLIKVFPDTMLYPDWVPTYYGNSYLWNFSSGNIVNHNCVANDTFNVEMNVITPTTGPGTFRGRVLEGLNFRNIGDPVPGVDVKVGRDPNGGVAYQGVTSELSAPDHGGYFYFNNVVIGDYIIYIDIPGLERDSSYHVSVTSTNNQFIYLDYIADSTSIYVVVDAGLGIIANPKGKNNFSIYPNPSKNTIGISYNLSENSKVNIDIYDILGNKIQNIISKEQQSGKYLQYFTNERNQLNAGIYFIALTVNGNKSVERWVLMDE